MAARTPSTSSLKQPGLGAKSASNIGRVKQQEATAANVASPKGISQKKATDGEIQVARRRLSVVSDNKLVEGLAAVTTADAEGVQDGTSTIGCYAGVSKKGYAPYNPRKKNQDSMIMQFHAESKTLLLGVFDGHGEAGDGVSQYFRTHFPPELFNHAQFAPTGDVAKDTAGIQAAVAFALNAVEKRVIRDTSIDTEFSGSTGVVVVIRDRLLIVGNVGDSRITRGFMQSNVLTAAAVSKDHKPDVPTEKARILAAGGRVFAVEYDDGAPFVSPVSSEPEFFVHMLDSNDRCLVIATDGLWEFMTDDEVIKMVAPHTDPKQAVDVLILEANRRWMKEEQVIDDTTVIVAFVDIK
ncbi:unnamed protein product [Aphanomyces euteiches]